MTNDSGNGNKNRGVQRAAALDPRAPLLVQPFKRLVEEGFILELKVVWTPTTVTVEGEPDDRLIAVAGSGLQKGQKYAIAKLSSIADDGDLIPTKGKKSKNDKNPSQPDPKKSLCAKDLDLDFAGFVARAQAVAKNCSGPTLVGRVRSAELFEGRITTKFSDWWEKAEPGPRCTSLTLEKYRKEMSGHSNGLKYFADLKCPFRGTAEFVVTEKDQEKKPEEKEKPKAASPNGKSKK